MSPSALGALQLIVATAPNWTDKLSAFGSAAAGLGFVGTATGVWLARGQLRQAGEQLREARRDRHVHAIAEMGLRWDGDQLSKARNRQRRYDNVALADKVAARQRPIPHSGLSRVRWQRNASELQLLLRVPNYFEDLGLMVDRDALDLEIVKEAVGDLAIGEWRRWELAIDSMSGGPYSNFRRLVERLRSL